VGFELWYAVCHAEMGVFEYQALKRLERGFEGRK
jgi:hypothetical protein